MYALLLALPPADPGKAPPEPTGGLDSWFPLLLILFVAVLFLPALFNKKEKHRQKRLAELKKHDKVVTSGGIYGSIVALDDATATLEIARDVRIKVKRTSIYDVEKPGETKPGASGKPTKTGAKR